MFYTLIFPFVYQIKPRELYVLILLFLCAFIKASKTLFITSSPSILEYIQSFVDFLRPWQPLALWYTLQLRIRVGRWNGDWLPNWRKIRYQKHHLVFKKSNEKKNSVKDNKSKKKYFLNFPVP